MSFFGKLKSRLFKSSAKLEEGLNAIVDENTVGESVELKPDAQGQQSVVEIPKSNQEPNPDGGSEGAVDPTLSEILSKAELETGAVAIVAERDPGGKDCRAKP